MNRSLWWMAALAVLAACTPKAPSKNGEVETVAPTQAPVGAPLTVKVGGVGFTPQLQQDLGNGKPSVSDPVVVVLDGTTRLPTTFVSDAQVEATLPAELTVGDHLLTAVRGANALSGSAKFTGVHPLLLSATGPSNGILNLGASGVVNVTVANSGTVDVSVQLSVTGDATITASLTDTATVGAGQQKSWSVNVTAAAPGTGHVAVSVLSTIGSITLPRLDQTVDLTVPGASSSSSSSSSTTISTSGSNSTTSASSSSSTSSSTSAGSTSSTSSSSASATSTSGSTSSSSSSSTSTSSTSTGSTGSTSSSSSSSSTGSISSSSTSASSTSGTGSTGSTGSGSTGSSSTSTSTTGTSGGCDSAHKLCGGACVAIDDPNFGCDPVACTPCVGPGQCQQAVTCDSTNHVCSYTASTDGTACNDGDLCTLIDQCSSGICMGGSPVTCTALDQCHAAGTCNPLTGQCSNPNAANGTSCNDNNDCTTSDVCTAGVCAGSAVTDGTSCNDGDACTQTDTCQSGTCQGSNPVVCVASDQCHAVGTCDTSTGLCSNPTQPDGSTCDDGNACTGSDVCTAGSCAGTAVVDGTSCNDGNPCTQTDTCQAGACTGSNPVVCSASDQCHIAGTCDPTTGVCSNPNAANGIACNDGNACTQTDTCQAGICTGSNPVTCSAQDQCHVAGTCDPTTGVCSNPNAANGTACNDSNLCTQTDTCQAGICTGSNPVVCSAQDQCHVAGTCDTTTGVCSNPNAANGTSCNDSNPCTQTDTCQAGVCTGSNPKTCSAADQCHVAGTCDPSTGVCSNPNATDGTSCNDSNACTSSDVCVSGVCGGTACSSSTCGNSLSAFTGTQTAGWNFNGSARYDTGTNAVALVDGQSNGEAGTVLYQNPIVMDSATVSFDFQITTVNGRADGLAFVMETNGNTAVGAGYGGFGVMGLTGYALELDIFDSGPCDPGNGNHAGIDFLTSCAGGSPPNAGIPMPVSTSNDLFDGSLPGNGVGDIADGQSRTVIIQLNSGHMSVAITNPSGTPFAIANLQNVALPGYVPGTPYYIGFGAGTGSNGMAALTEIQNVSVSFAANQCL